MMSFEPVFLLAGQSNMAGRCDESELQKVVLSSCNHNNNEPEFSLCWNNDCNFGPMDGSHSDMEWRPLQCQYSPGLQRHLFGPEMGIAQTLAPRLAGRTKAIHLLKFAMGSTNLHCNWKPNNTDETTEKPAQKAYYRRFIQFCQAALAQPQPQQQPHSTQDDHLIIVPTEPAKMKKIVGMFWLQGESDSAKAKDANAYLSNFQTFVAAVRRDLQVPDLPVVVSPVVWKGKKIDVVNQALHQAGNGAVYNCICIDQLQLDCLEVQSGDDCICPDHLTGKSILDIGRRMGEAFPIQLIDS